MRPSLPVAQSYQGSDVVHANLSLDGELRRVRRFATMLHDPRSLTDLAAYERELEAQLRRTAVGTDALRQMLRPLTQRTTRSE